MAVWDRLATDLALTAARPGSRTTTSDVAGRKPCRCVGVPQALSGASFRERGNHAATARPGQVNPMRESPDGPTSTSTRRSTVSLNDPATVGRPSLLVDIEGG